MKSVESSGCKDANGHASGCEGGAAISGKTNSLLSPTEFWREVGSPQEMGLHEHSIRKATLKIIHLGRISWLASEHWLIILGISESLVGNSVWNEPHHSAMPQCKEHPLNEEPDVEQSPVRPNSIQQRVRHTTASKAKHTISWMQENTTQHLGCTVSSKSK